MSFNFNDFVAQTNTKLSDNPGAKEVFDFLADPLNTYSLILFSELGLPAISGIVSKLEETFGDNSTFPLSKFENRQIVGRMVKYILSFYGYEPVAGGLNEQARLRHFSKARYFKTAAVYALKTEPKCKIEATVVKL